MSKSVIIRGITYPDVPSVDIPLASGSGNATFYDVSVGTLTSGDQMLDGVTAIGNSGATITGTIPTNTSSDVTVSGATVTIPAGNYASAVSKSVANGSVTAPSSISGTSASVSTGTNTLTLSKTISVTPNVTTQGYITSGTAGNASVSLTASVTTKGAATITPGTSNQTIASGTYLTGAQTILGDSQLVAGNIVSGHSIFGVNGTATLVSVSQDSVTKVLTIS